MRGRDIGEEIRIGNLRPFLRTRLMERLLEFGEWYIRAPMRDGDHVEALAALLELRKVYVGLSTVYPEDYVEMLAKIDAGLDRLREDCRIRLEGKWLLPKISDAEVEQIRQFLDGDTMSPPIVPLAS
jgi:hypothetical protein